MTKMEPWAQYKDAVILTKDAYQELCLAASKWNELKGCDDCISREEAIKYMYGIVDVIKYYHPHSKAKNEEVHMTNREKFEQVFHTPITDTEYLHGCLVCPDDVCNAHSDCKGCPYDDWWYQEYKGGATDDNE